MGQVSNLPQQAVWGRLETCPTISRSHTIENRCNNPQAPNAVNYDESKANPYPSLPDPLLLKNGKKVTSAKMWWNQRRPEIVEDFDREVYGRVPKNIPNVKWEVTNTTKETKFEIHVITKQLIGHVDNSTYPLITVNIQLTLTTPANASWPVPVMMEFGFAGARPGAALAAAPGGGAPNWQQQLLTKGWGYAIIVPSSIQADNGAGLTQGVINFGELVENLAAAGEYHWMAGNFIKYAGPLTWNDLPIDAHELIALCAPRPTFISYGAAEGPGAEGKWVDQRGSFMAAVAAGPVFKFAIAN